MNFETLSEDQFLLIQSLTDEYELGMKALNGIGSRSVTFYGGSRVQVNSTTYQHIHLLAKGFAEKGWGVVTGGGPGVMSAALSGAKSVGGKAVAFMIKIDNEAPFATPDIALTFDHFSARKYCLRQSNVLIYAPGGIGTLDELMENLTLMATKKSPIKPIFLFDSKFWAGYLEWFQDLAYTKLLVDPQYLNLFKTVDSAEEVIDYLFSTEPNKF